MPKSKRKKILICYADAGGGHKSVATALNIELSKNEEFDVAMVNIAKDYGSYLTRRFDIYYKILTAHFPYIWEKVCVKFPTYFPSVAKYLYEPIIWHLSKKSFRKFVKENPADIYISTIHLYNAGLSNVKRKSGKNYKLITVITDIAYIPYFWINQYHDKIIFPTKEAFLHSKNLLKNIDNSKIDVLGLPISKDYYGNNFTSIVEKDPKRKLNILITIGGEGLGEAFELCKILDSKLSGISIQVAAGKNQKLVDEISLSKWKNSVTSFGWVPGLREKYDWADLVIMKAGPTTIWECIVLDKPMIIFDYIKGQEDGNVDFAVNYGRAKYLRNFEEIAEKLSGNDFENISKSFPKGRFYSESLAQTNWSKEIGSIISKE